MNNLALIPIHETILIHVSVLALDSYQMVNINDAEKYNIMQIGWLMTFRHIQLHRCVAPKVTLISTQ